VPHGVNQKQRKPKKRKHPFPIIGQIV